MREAADRPISVDEFIRANTLIAAPPLTPEIRLHLATEITPIWQATEEALRERNVSPPFWAFCWPGGQALARYILDHRHIVEGLRVLDFAAGGGVSAIATAMAGAKSVLANDVDPYAAAAIRLNAKLNGVSLAVSTTNLLGGANEGWDVVIAGDVCYEQPMSEAVTSWLRALATDGTLVLMGDPGRNYLPKEGLDVVAAYDVPTSLELEDREMRHTGILKVPARRPNAI